MTDSPTRGYNVSEGFPTESRSFQNKFPLCECAPPPRAHICFAKRPRPGRAAVDKSPGAPWARSVRAPPACALLEWSRCKRGRKEHHPPTNVERCPSAPARHRQRLAFCRACALVLPAALPCRRSALRRGSAPCKHRGARRFMGRIFAPLTAVCSASSAVSAAAPAAYAGQCAPHRC